MFTRHFTYMHIFHNLHLTLGDRVTGGSWNFQFSAYFTPYTNRLGERVLQGPCHGGFADFRSKLYYSKTPIKGCIKGPAELHS